MNIEDLVRSNKITSVAIVPIDGLSIELIKNISFRQFKKTKQIQKIILYDKVCTNIEDYNKCDIIIILCSSNKEEDINAVIKCGEKFSKDKLTVCIYADNQLDCSEKITNVFDCDICTEEKNFSAVLKMILIEMSEGVNGGLNLQSFAEELKNIKNIKYIQSTVDIVDINDIEKSNELNALLLMTNKALKIVNSVNYKAFIYISMPNLSAFHIGQITKHFKSKFTDIEFQGDSTQSKNITLKILYGEL